MDKICCTSIDVLNLNNLIDKGNMISEIIKNIYNENKNHDVMFKEFINFKLM